METQPITITGTNVRKVFTYSNGRVRCASSQKGHNSYSLECHAVIVDENGSEQIATEIDPKVSINWQPPERIEGGEIVSTRCHLGNLSLSQICEVTTTGTGTRARVDLNIADNSVLPPLAKVEFDVVYFDISVKTYGFLPNIPFHFNLTESSSGNLENLGFEGLALDPLKTHFGDIRQFCQLGDKLFFSADSFIYSFHNQKVHLYAGSENLANKKDVSHRLRVNFGSRNLPLLCDEQTGSVLAGGIFSYRIRNLHPDGTISVVAGNGEVPLQGQIVAEGVNAPLVRLMPIAMTLLPDRSVAFADLTQKMDGSYEVKIRKVNRLGTLSTLHEMGGLTPNFLGVNEQISLASLPDGSIVVSDRDRHKIFRIETNGNSVVLAGTGTAGCSSDGDPATSTVLNKPTAPAVAKDGILYFTEMGCQRIRRIDAQGTLQTVLTLDSLGLHPSFQLVPDGFLISNGDKIRKVAQAGAITEVLGNTKTAFLGAHAVPSLRPLETVDGIAIARDGNLIVVHPGDHSVRKIEKDGTLTILSGISKQPGYSGDGGPAVLAKMYWPHDVATLPDNSIVIAERGNKIIRKIDAAGIITTIAGQGNAWPGNGGAATNAQLDNLNALSIAPDGSIIFAEASWIRRIDAQTGILSVVAGGEASGFAGDGGPAHLAKLGYPAGIAFDTDGSLLIVDQTNMRIRKVSPSGNISTIFHAPSIWGASRISVDRTSRRVYVVLWQESKIVALDPVLLADGSTVYQSSVFFGGKAAKDCGAGVIQIRAVDGSPESHRRASLSVICSGVPRALTIKDNCSAPDGKITMVFSQTFGLGFGNVVTSEMPCAQ